ncbi:MAG: MlaD family protein [Planctomycetes bacterium]|nr:MlaD family protein [Planctomycetota bacterium]
MAGRKQTATMELAIGATIIAGVIVLIVMLMAWGNTTSFLGRHYRVLVNMTNVGGLKEGAPVKMGGFQIGRVSTIRIRPGGTDMEIVLDIDETHLLRRGSTAKVSTAGLVGDSFMEIIPGSSSDTIRRSATIADAERLESSPLPDLSELLTKINSFGDQLIILTANLNDIVGDDQFRTNVKSLAANIDSISYQANLILQRGQVVVDNIETAAQNISTLSHALKDSVPRLTTRVEEVADTVKITVDNLKGLTDSAQATIANLDGGVTDIRNTVRITTDSLKGLTDSAQATIANLDGGVADIRNTVLITADSLKGLTGSAETVIANLDGGITDLRNAVNNSIGNPEIASDLADTIRNVNSITDNLARRSGLINRLLDNLDSASGNMKEITDAIEPAVVKDTVRGLSAAIGTMSGSIDTISGAINSLTGVVEDIRKEPVLALSINKAADRIVKMKFDEMSRQPHFRSSDQVLQEINRWVRENMNRGYMIDPAFSRDNRPYTLTR